MTKRPPPSLTAPGANPVPEWADHWRRIVDLLIARGGLSKSASSMLCPEQSDDIVSRLRQEGVAQAMLLGALAEILELPLYDETQHGPAEQSGSRWLFADHRLFVTDPFWTGCLNPEQLIGSEAFTRFVGFGLLFVDDSAQNTQATAQVLAQSESMIIDWLVNASVQGYSDLRFAPYNEQSARLSHREDGIQRTLLEYPLIPSDGRPPYALLINTILGLAGHHAGVWLVPLDGKINLTHEGRRLNIRISMRPEDVMGVTLPSIVARMLGSGLTLRALDQLGIPPRELEDLLNQLKRRTGLFLVTGPTGSGKSTMLYSSLGHIQDCCPGRSIQTVEDPVEIFLPGISQTEVNEQAGMTFEAALRSMLRHDLDVGLIGEIRDTPTAKLAVRVALTGHFVMATLHTKSALSAIDRMLDLGVSPHLLASHLSGVYAQRLVRSVCPHCSTRVTFASRPEWPLRYGELYMPTVNDDFREADPNGCEHCDGGYKGRQIICELALIDPATASLIASGAPLQEIETLKHHSGTRTLWHHAIELCRSGQTTIDECEDVLDPRTNFGQVFRPGHERLVS